MFPIKNFIWIASFLLSACQMQYPLSGEDIPSEIGATHTIEAPYAWGGEPRCGLNGCLLGLVEHENNLLVVHKYEKSSWKLVGKYPVGYHPDSAFWINDNFLVAAVEFSQTLDIFKIDAFNASRVKQLGFSFRPRNGLHVETEGNQHQLLAVPYSGNKIAWATWVENDPTQTIVNEEVWCEAPWHPAQINKYPGGQGKAIVVACRGDGRIMLRTLPQNSGELKLLAAFKDVPRQARPSPTGSWLYIALEINGSNARINMLTGEVQRLPIPGNGSYSVVPLADDLVAWGSSGRVYLQKIRDDGLIIEQRWLKSSGFSSEMKSHDINQDGNQDLFVFNSNNNYVDVIYGPLWNSARTGDFKLD